jgi:Dullard-like phosphatase family protein
MIEVAMKRSALRATEHIPAVRPSTSFSVYTYLYVYPALTILWQCLQQICLVLWEYWNIDILEGMFGVGDSASHLTLLGARKSRRKQKAKRKVRSGGVRSKRLTSWSEDCCSSDEDSLHKGPTRSTRPLQAMGSMRNLHSLPVLHESSLEMQDVVDEEMQYTLSGKSHSGHEKGPRAFNHLRRSPRIRNTRRGGDPDSDSMDGDFLPHDESSGNDRSSAGSHKTPGRRSDNLSLLSRLVRPSTRPKKILVLDLDETLIHSTYRSSMGAVGVTSTGSSASTARLTPDYRIEVMINQHPCLYYVYKRPFVDIFLHTVSKWYNLAIFTASMPEYANPVISFLQASSLVEIAEDKRYFRHHCRQNFFGQYLKDLTIVEKDLSKVILVDNSLVSFRLQPRNGVPVEDWISDPLDECLLDMLPLLDGLRFVDDVRSLLGFREL